MSEVFVINTLDGIVADKREDEIGPLTLYDDNHPMLQQEIPEYKGILPSRPMDRLSEQLKMTLKKFNGLGLSANQCGVFERMFVMLVNNEVITCINPKVLEKSDEIDRGREGCLSYPGMYLSVPRHRWIIVEFNNTEGDILQARLEGVEARCFLHEMDHMNGVRFVQHAGPVAIRLAKQKQQKLIKKHNKLVKGVQ
jgi:peptide deformylase